MFFTFGKYKIKIMRGINYLTDEKGKRIAVMIDLKKHRILWEDVKRQIKKQK
jgi:hypothetical protein